MFVAWRDLRFARGRFLLITAVVALLCFMVGFLSGLTGGLAWQNVSGLLGLHGDRVLLAPASSTSAPSFADSQFTAAQVEQVAAIDGAVVEPIGISQLRAVAGDSRAAVAVIGTADAALADAPERSGAVVLSAPAAAALQVGVDDTVTIAGVDFVVDGIAGDLWYSHTPVVRATIDDWRVLAAATGVQHPVATALVVTGGADVDPTSIGAPTGTVSQSPLLALQWLPAFRSEIGSLLLMVVLLFGISALVVGAFFAVWTLQRTGDIAVLKALGASDRMLRLDALGQAALVLVVGAAIGFGVVGLLGALLVGGTLPFVVSPLTTLLPAAVMLVLGLAGAAFSLRSVTGADPLTALGSTR
jgi:putative ABC transport system permease protein